MAGGTVLHVGSATITGANSINIAGMNQNFKENDEIILIDATGSIAGDFPSTIKFNDVYTFKITNENGQLIATVMIIVPPTPTLSGGSPSSSGNGSSGGGGLVVLDDQGGVITPVITSQISFEFIEGGVRLFIDAISIGWNGESYDQFFQWQVLVNGNWVDISGATTQIYDYIGLEPGEYTIRCIIRNSTGGEMISPWIIFTVS